MAKVAGLFSIVVLTGIYVSFGVSTAIKLDSQLSKEKQNFWLNLAWIFNWLSAVFLGYLAIWSFVSAGFSAVFKPFPLDMFLAIVYLALTVVFSFGIYGWFQIFFKIRDYDGKVDTQLITYAKISCIISVLTLCLIIGLTVSRKWGLIQGMWQGLI